MSNIDQLLFQLKNSLMQEKWLQVIQQTSTLILDKKSEIHQAIICLLASGHLLIEDVPGVGKTTLVQIIAKLLGLEHQRIQFTSDLLPSDIVGNSIYDSEKREFKFFQGPLFAHLVLADELNRANPRTQSALLQAMEEGQVTVDRTTWNLPKPFFLIATQNPRFQTGTFPLPESQLDRFLMSLTLNYASSEAEIKIFQGQDPRLALPGLTAILTQAELVESQKKVEQITVSPLLAKYISALLNESRRRADHFPALSTRTGIALSKAAKACAFLQGRNYALPEDVQAISRSVLSHRLGGTEGVSYGQSRSQELVQVVAVPS